MSFEPISENKILVKISEFTVLYPCLSYAIVRLSVRLRFVVSDAQIYNICTVVYSYYFISYIQGEEDLTIKYYLL